MGERCRKPNARDERLLLEREHEHRLWALYTIAGLAQAALARGDLERAGLLWGAAAVALGEAWAS